MRRTTLAAVTAALIAIPLLAGCGSSSDEGSSQPSAAATSTPKAPPSTVSGTPITVGFVCSCTGPLAKTIGRSEEVIQSWAKWTNAHGGLNGHPVKVIAADDGQNPAKGLEVVKQLVEQDKVMAIVGQMSFTTPSWAKYATAQGVPVVGGTPLDAAFLSNPDFFLSGSNLLMTFTGMVQLAQQNGKKHIGVYYCAETPVCAQAPKLVTALAKPLGLQVTSTRVSSTAPSYTAPCLSFKQKSVDALIVAANSTAVPRIVGACAQQGFKPLNLAGAGTTERSWLSDPVLTGTLVAASNANYTDTSIPGIKSFTEALNQYAPGLTDSPQFSWPYLSPWAGGQLFAAAAKAGKLTPTSTSADVKKGLYTLKDETLDDIAPPLNFSAGKPGFPGCYFQAKIGDGAISTLNANKPACLPPAALQKLASALG
jgi:branched-chain amino acid transport system substrate-binding protein